MARLGIGCWLPVFLLAACRSFDVEREQVLLRYRPDVDTLDVVLVYDGVGAPGDTDESFDKAVHALRDIGGGRRRAMLYDWPFDIDLTEAIESTRKELSEESDTDPSDLARAFLDYEGNIRFDASRFLTDERGRLCLLQGIRIEHASQGLQLLERTINRELQRQCDDDEGQEDAWEALAIQRARHGGGWVHFNGTTLEVSFPMTPETAAKTLVSLTEDSEAVERSLLRSLTALHVTGDEARLCFAPAADGWITFELADPERSYDPEVAGRIVSTLAVPAGSLGEALREFKAKP
jgi:hypothetical protein